MHIRRAELSDIPAVARIHVDTWHSTYTGLAPQSLLDSLTYEEKERMWLQVINPEHPTLLLVAESNGEVIGFVAVGPEKPNIDPETTNTADPKRGELYTLYISDAAQRSGVGAALFHAGVDSLREQGVEIMALWVLEGNTKGIAFYDKMGGTTTSTKTFEVHGVTLREFRYQFSISPV